MEPVTIEQVQEKMIELFGDRIVNPEHWPRQFEYQVKLARWMLQPHIQPPTEISTCPDS